MDHTVSIIFNGPPSSGKDTVCDHLLEYYGDGTVNHLRFKDQLFTSTCSHYGISYGEFMMNYTTEKKNLSHEKLGGLSPREALIHVSEDICKPKYGKDYFGQQSAKRLQENKVNVFSDGGFLEEINPIYDASDYLLIVQLYRTGCTFEGDSRSYVGTPSFWFGKGNKPEFEFERRLFTNKYPVIAYINNQPKDRMFAFAENIVDYYVG